MVDREFYDAHRRRFASVLREEGAAALVFAAGAALWAVRERGSTEAPSATGAEVATLVPTLSDPPGEIDEPRRGPGVRVPQAPDAVQRLLRYGSSPRGGQSAIRLAKARAIRRGRPFVSDDDLAEVVVPALRHRLVFGYEGEASGVGADELVSQAFEAARRLE